jgi:hypothetical protein
MGLCGQCDNISGFKDAGLCKAFIIPPEQRTGGEYSILRITYPGCGNNKVVKKTSRFMCLPRHSKIKAPDLQIKIHEPEDGNIGFYLYSDSERFGKVYADDIPDLLSRWEFYKEVVDISMSSCDYYRQGRSIIALVRFSQ